MKSITLALLGTLLAVPACTASEWEQIKSKINPYITGTKDELTDIGIKDPTIGYYIRKGWKSLAETAEWISDSIQTNRPRTSPIGSDNPSWDPSDPRIKKALVLFGAVGTLYVSYRFLKWLVKPRHHKKHHDEDHQ